jgi:ribosome-associated protein
VRVKVVPPIQLPATDEQLLAECDQETFRASGKGGQHVNTTNSAIRLIHRPTGLRTSCQQERSQHLNRAICLKKLRAKVARLNFRPAPRIPTRKTRSAKQRTLESKAKQAFKKKLRSKKFTIGGDE